MLLKVDASQFLVLFIMFLFFFFLKIGPVREYIQMLCENPHLKFLIFCYHHCMMDGVQEVLRNKKVKFIRIDGSTKPSDRQVSNLGMGFSESHCCTPTYLYVHTHQTNGVYTFSSVDLFCILDVLIATERGEPSFLLRTSQSFCKNKRLFVFFMYS